ncbi:cobaltochelatase subunit CobN [Rubrivivax benzoatilyticus]|uniref:Cobaltochelatase subunit CobN n=1 Tax=Rubrivivax benzoatilyticus TaxID=316997 RepID=A0ABX0HSY3_9BURK|nr:cobaltochelatase subunit CobN [Rubrivivax benzoatilyticus]NHK96844.1 cobaltochelatase subunit CobN [Rubrivivax benzoatilyticus]NHL24559.1 cobaltochelatase subunit CobN [Rubrivivax benzoatilyticus]
MRRDASPPATRRPCQLAAPLAAARRRLAAAAVVLAALLLLLALPAQAARVLVVTTSPVPPAKLAALARAGGPLGLEVQARYVEKLTTIDATLWDGADLVLLDAPRAHIEAWMREKLAPALPALERRRHVWLSTAEARPQGVPADLAKRLHAYYVNGAGPNLRHFVQTLDDWLDGRPWGAHPDPVVFPASGIYHPKFPGLVTASTRDYLAWKGVAADGQRAPVVGIVFHPQSVAAEETELLDALISRLEAQGAVPLAFYTPVLDADAVRRVALVDGRPAVDVLINTQITLSAEARRTEFEALGVPVIQAMNYRRGDTAAWRADPQGVRIDDVPFYLSQAETAGITDILIASANGGADERLEPIAPQVDAVVAKAMKLVALQRKAPADKHVALFFWNYPPGEKNLSASFMNLPRSLVATLAALRQAGYTTETQDEAVLTASLQRLLEPAYRPAADREVLERLLRDGLADWLPVARYRAWLAGLPPEVGARIDERWGAPETSTWIVRRGGQDGFVVPRLHLGGISLLPQPPRGERGEDRDKSIYHSTSAVPSHHYYAVYLWAREAFAADALVHFGTHGTQEWLPGKERGLSVFDDALLAVGDVPVVYPYIVDNIGEALQTKRRGRAVVVSHQTPALAPAGLHDALTALHDALHQWLAQGEGQVRDALRRQIADGVKRERIAADMGWSEARIEADFPAFITALHDHLHELALTVQPVGLHSFGRPPEERWRLATVMEMLGRETIVALAAPGEQADEVLVGDWKQLTETATYRRLHEFIVEGADTAALPPSLREAIERGRRWYADLGAEGEFAGLLDALAGRYRPTSYGGDPIKNPDSLPTGRNLYGFDPSRVPTKAAWEAGKQALEQLAAAHRAKTGRTPAKLAFTLWSVETMRHQGLLEAQALWALGVEPVWDAGGRVADVKLVPRAALGRPRIDVVLSATGLYRDHFPNVMRQLAKAARLASQADEADNPVAANARRIAAGLRARGLDAAAAERAGQTRIFSSESGRYGSGLDDAALATDTWKTQAEGDRKLATLYLSRMQYAYGPDEGEWGQAGAKANLYAEHLKGTEGAVLARSSNLYGMLTTDDPFQYLGGLSLAVRHLDGKAPELYISNLRGPGAGRVEGAAEFLAKELATRNFHPGHISGLMAEGYAGTLQVLDGINNFAGWQSVAREIVRDDQWQEFMDVYVRDKHQLGIRRWFESRNPHAMAQVIERMLEAARLGQWKAAPESVAELKQRWRELAQRHDVRPDSAAFAAFVGYGLAPQPAALAPTPAKPAEAAPVPPEPAAARPPVEGLLLERVAPPPAEASRAAVALAAIALALAGGALRGRRSRSSLSFAT